MEILDVDRPEGAMPVALFAPSTPPDKSVVVFMEAFGFVESIFDVGKMLADAGYRAIIPDLFYFIPKPNTAEYDNIPMAMDLMGDLVARGTQFVNDVDAALDVLSVEQRVGLVGFCMGGALSFAYACHAPQRSMALASFYGGGIVRLLDQAEQIDCPIELFFAGRDTLIPSDEIHQIKRRLSEQDHDYSVTVYTDADHGFFNRQREDVYQSTYAKDAWSKVLDMLARANP